MIDPKEFNDIRGSQMLKGLSGEDLQKLAGVCEMRPMGEGTTIFLENMPGEALFLIRKGIVRISRMFAEGDEKILVVLGPEDIFGEMAIVDGLPRSATARVAENAELISLKKKDFESFCRQHPEPALKIVLNIVRVFSKRVREAGDEYREMLLWSMKKE